MYYKKNVSVKKNIFQLMNPDDDEEWSQKPENPTSKIGI